MPLAYETQRRVKTEEFTTRWRAAGLPPTPLGWLLSEAPPLRYRNRVRCQVTPGGQVRFFNPEKSAACPVLELSVRQAVDLAQRIALEHPSAMRYFASLELRAHDSSGRGGVIYRRRQDPAPGRGSAGLDGAGFEQARQELSEAWPEAWLVAGLADGPTPCQRWQVAHDVWVDVPLDAFMQVNTRVNQLLVAHVRSQIVERRFQSFADLFMGAGNFALPLLVEGLAGYAVEAHAGAVKAAVLAAGAQGSSFTRAEAGDANSRARAWVEAGSSVDVVIADPPRAGLGAAAVPLAQLATHSVVLCSCNPRSLVRDVAALAVEGFRAQRVLLFDMCPQTPHVESVVWLDRVRPRAQPNIFS